MKSLVHLNLELCSLMAIKVKTSNLKQEVSRRKKKLYYWITNEDKVYEITFPTILVGLLIFFSMIDLGEKLN